MKFLYIHVHASKYCLVANKIRCTEYKIISTPNCYYGRQKIVDFLGSLSQHYYYHYMSFGLPYATEVISFYRAWLM